MIYIESAIDSLVSRLFEKATRDSTPRKYAGDMYEAAEVIQQLQRKISDLKSVQKTEEEQK